MSNSAFINNTNNIVIFEQDCATGAEFNLNAMKNMNDEKNNSLVEKENNSKKLFGNGKTIESGVSEKNSNTLSKNEVCSQVSDEKFLTDDQKKPKCQLGLQLKSNLKAEEAIDNQINISGKTVISGERNVENENVFNKNISLVYESLPSITNQANAKSSDSTSSLNNVEVPLPAPHLESSPNSIPNENNLSSPNLDLIDINPSKTILQGLADNSIVISNSNAIPQSDSIVSSNYSLSQLQDYYSDDDVIEVPVTAQKYREDGHQTEDSEDDSDSSTSSSSSIFISESSDSESEEDDSENSKKKPKPIKAKGELSLNDLPPIKDLQISVPEEDCVPMGTIYQIVDQLVIVQAFKDSPAYDLDTVLFRQGGKPLGNVFDVFGPVVKPYYCIRFNSKEHIQQQNITLEQTVYAAPKTKFAKFVFVAQLMKLKGSDASWENDMEPPEIHLDYSDDEQEQQAKKNLSRNKKVVFTPESDPDEPARKKHAAYVKRMNARNLRLSAITNNQNTNKNRPEGRRILWQPNLPPMTGTSPAPRIGVLPPPPRPPASCHQMFGRPPSFDLRVPPPPNSPFPNHSESHFYQAELSSPPQMFGPSTSSNVHRPPCFATPHASPGPFNGPRMQPFSPPPPYCTYSYNNLPGNQRSNSTLSIWNPSLPQSGNVWESPLSSSSPRNVPPPSNGPPLRSAPLPPRNVYPMSIFPVTPNVVNIPYARPIEFPNSFPNSPNPTGHFFRPITHRPWLPQPTNLGNSSQMNFNPSVPPPAPNVYKK